MGFSACVPCALFTQRWPVTYNDGMNCSRLGQVDSSRNTPCTGRAHLSRMWYMHEPHIWYMVVSTVGGTHGSRKWKVVVQLAFWPSCPVIHLQHLFPYLCNFRALSWEVLNPNGRTLSDTMTIQWLLPDLFKHLLLVDPTKRKAFSYFFFIKLVNP